MNMKRVSALLLGTAALAVLLCGCPKKEAPVETTVPETTAAPTVPEDGNPNDVTCKGSYTVSDADAAKDGGKVVAVLGDAQLTLGQLRLAYWMEVAAYRQENHAVSPDFSQSLDTQLCDLEGTAATWQQYFLQRALNTWHSSQALVQQSQQEGTPTEGAYQPNLENHEKYLQEKPATRYLYGFNESFQPNDLHQEYLDSIPQLLEALAQQKSYADISALAQAAAGAGVTGEDLQIFADTYNRGYAFYTELGYAIDPADEDVDAFLAEHSADYASLSGRLVDIRHILLVPEMTDAAGNALTEEQAWENCQKAAEKLLKQWEASDKEDHTFAEFANLNSADEGSRLNGGLYQRLHQGQLAAELDAWCFDGSRQAGDTVLLKTENGYEILYFRGARDAAWIQAREDLITRESGELIADAREAYPMNVDYNAITLGNVSEISDITHADLLYPDVAHQRYPSVPLYLQQDYPNTMYGNYKITSHGCGITTMAMLASYLADDELTPPELCAIYGDYCLRNGTNSTLFVEAPAEMGFYVEKRVFKPHEVTEALEQGKIVISMQHAGFWTRGGHYILLEEMLPDGQIQVRDSNIFNYGRLQGHKIDAFKFNTITPSGAMFWIYQHKITNIPACSRCGDASGASTPENFLLEAYRCEKCDQALLRRNSYLAECGN